MSHKEVYAVVSELVPCRHMSWGDEKKPKLPWAVYYADQLPIEGDDAMWAQRLNWTVELYQQRRDAELERKLEGAINATFGTFSKEESWVKTEGVLLVTYSFYELEGVDYE